LPLLGCLLHPFSLNYKRCAHSITKRVACVNLSDAPLSVHTLLWSAHIHHKVTRASVCACCMRAACNRDVRVASCAARIHRVNNSHTGYAKQHEEWGEGAGLDHVPLCEPMAFLSGMEHVSIGTDGNRDNERENTARGVCGRPRGRAGPVEPAESTCRSGEAAVLFILRRTGSRAGPPCTKTFFAGIPANSIQVVRILEQPLEDVITSPE